MGAEREDDSFNVEYHNFDNPLYSEGGASTETPPTYNRTYQPGRRGGNAASTRWSSVGAETRGGDATPTQVGYDYITVNQVSGGGGGRREREAASPGQSSDQDTVYESIHG